MPFQSPSRRKSRSLSKQLEMYSTMLTRRDRYLIALTLRSLPASTSCTRRFRVLCGGARACAAAGRALVCGFSSAPHSVSTATCLLSERHMAIVHRLTARATSSGGHILSLGSLAGAVHGRLLATRASGFFGADTATLTAAACCWNDSGCHFDGDD